MVSRLQQALMLAAQGYYLFPLEENSKLPEAGYNWRSRSTRDPEIIKSWFVDKYMGFKRNPNIAIDCGKSGIYPIDVDIKSGKHGDKTFAKLNKRYGFPLTLVFETASGGQHYVYNNTANLRNTAEKLGPGIDTRGVGGYIVAPGSEIDGKKYRILEKREVADLPEWIGEVLAAYKFVAEKDKGASISEDEPSSISRAISWLKDTAEPAYEGEGGDHVTFATAAKLREFGCSEEKTLELMLDYWNPRCEPEWDPEELERKVYNAFRYGQKATGAASAEAEFDDEELPSMKKHKEQIKQQDDIATPLQPFDINKVPRRQWIFSFLALAKKLTLLVAPAGAGKSTFTLSMAISKATGRAILGLDPKGRGRVWIYNNEDDMEEMHRRLGAIMQHFGIPMSELYDEDEKPMLFVNSGEDRPLSIARRNDAGDIKAVDAKRLIESIKKHDIKMLIVDPFSETHEEDENDNKKIQEVAKIYRKVAWETDCAIILVHHTKKLDSASSDGHEGNLDTVRGASSLGGVARLVVTYFSMSKTKAKQYGVQEEHRRKYSGLAVAKANMSADSGADIWFEKLGEKIGISDIDDEGEEVGVLRPIKLSRDGADTLKDANRELLYDIETACDGDTLIVAELAETLVEHHPMQQGKKAKSLEKAILRMFEHGALGFNCKKYRLELIEQRSTKVRGPRKVSAVQCIAMGNRNTPEEEALM